MKQHHTTAEAAVNFEAMVAKPKVDVTRRLGLRPRFSWISRPEISVGRLEISATPGQRAWRAFSFGGMQDIQIAHGFEFHG